MTLVVVLDVETTGKDRARDQIIEVGIQIGLGEDAQSLTWRIKPDVPVNAEATKVHGISDADLANEPPFGLVAHQILGPLAEADVIVGYNVAFDIDMLQAELSRAGLSPLDLGSKQIVDVLRLWQHVEPRTLSAAHDRFVGEPLPDAHQAAADVAATGRVLLGMVSDWGLQAGVSAQHEVWNWSELAAIADPFTSRANWIGPSHHIQWDVDGNAVFGFGKNQNRRVDQTDPGFLRWVIGKDFPPHVREICAAALRLPGVHLKPWIAERYPRRAAVSTEAA